MEKLHIIAVHFSYTGMDIFVFYNAETAAKQWELQKTHEWPAMYRNCETDEVFRHGKQILEE